MKAEIREGQRYRTRAEGPELTLDSGAIGARNAHPGGEFRAGAVKPDEAELFMSEQREKNSVFGARAR